MRPPICVTTPPALRKQRCPCRIGRSAIRGSRPAAGCSCAGRRQRARGPSTTPGDTPVPASSRSRRSFPRRRCDRRRRGRGTRVAGLPLVLRPALGDDGTQGAVSKAASKTEARSSAYRKKTSSGESIAPEATRSAPLSHNAFRSIPERADEGERRRPGRRTASAGGMRGSAPPGRAGGLARSRACRWPPAPRSPCGRMPRPAPRCRADFYVAAQGGHDLRGPPPSSGRRGPSRARRASRRRRGRRRLLLAQAWAGGLRGSPTRDLPVIPRRTSPAPARRPDRPCHRPQREVHLGRDIARRDRNTPSARASASAGRCGGRRAGGAGSATRPAA